MKKKQDNIFMSMKINLPNSIEDIKLSQYLEFAKIQEKGLPESEIERYLWTLDLIRVIGGATDDDIDELSIEETNAISIQMAKLIEGFTGFNKEVKPNFTINGVDYASVNIKTLKNNEYISINMLKEQYPNPFDLFPMMLAILVRPATKGIDLETGKETWTIEKFNKRDIENLKWRADLFKNQPCGDMMPVINFFLSGKETSLEPMTHSG